MVLPTPPMSEKQKLRGIFAHGRQPSRQYYEDAYGRRNAEEGAVGPQDVCEPDSVSEDELQRPAQYQRDFGSYKQTPERERSIDESNSEDDENSGSASPDDGYINQRGYTIAPNRNSKRSLRGAEYDNPHLAAGGREGGARTSPRPRPESEEKVYNKAEAPGWNQWTKRAGRIDAKASRKRVRRPAHRPLIKQQLASAPRAALKGRKLKAKCNTSRQAAWVMVDNGHINLDEYERM